MLLVEVSMSLAKSHAQFYQLRITSETRVILEKETAAFYQHQISNYPWNNSP